MKLRQLLIPVFLTITLCSFMPAQAAYDGSGSFSLVTTPAEITSGGYYVFIGGGTTDKAMANVRVGTAAAFTGLVVNVSGGKVENPGTDRVWRIDSAGSNFTIYNEAAGFYIGNAGSTVNGIASSSTATGAKYQWTFAATASNRTKIVNAEFSGRVLQWNNGTPRFACYGSTQQDIEIYKLDSGPVALNVSLDKANNFSIEEGEGAVITATAKGGEAPYVYAWSTTLEEGDYTASGNQFTILATAPAGDYDVRVDVTDDAEETAYATIDFTITAPAMKYGITVNAGANGSASTTPATEAAAGVQVTVNATPDSGYAVDTITVTAADSSNVPVAGGKFTMPGQAVTVTVTFKESAGESYIVDFEGDGETKGSYNTGTVTLNGKQWDMTQVMIGPVQPTDADWKNGARSARFRGYDTSAMTLLEDIANISSISFDYRRYGTESAQTNWVVEYSTDSGTSWTQVGSNFTATDTVQTFSETISESGANRVRIRAANGTGSSNRRMNIDDIEIVSGGGGPQPLSISLDKTSGFTVEQGSSAVVKATASGGTPPYSIYWDTDMASGEYTDDGATFTIHDTATLGNYFVKAEVEDAESNITNKTINFSVTAPAPKYAITVNAGANGSASTTPATEAAAGVQVTVNAKPNGGYAVDTITVTAADSSNVPVAGGKFTMPAQAVTVAVTFKEAPAGPDVLITFEDKTLPTGYAAGAGILEDGKNWATLRVLRGTDANDKKIGEVSARFYPVTTTNATLTMTEAYAEDITGVSFMVASYGTNDTMAGVELKLNVSSDGSTWTTVKTLTGAADITDTLTQVTVDSIPAGARYLQFFATAQAASGKRINLDNIGVSFGTPGPQVMSVSFDKADNFTVVEGNSAVITATASGGLPPYDYSWTSSLGGAYYSASGNQFTILATAPVGTYWAKVDAEDSGTATATKTINFAVTEEEPEPETLITFENKTLPGNYSAATATLEDGKNWATLRALRGTDGNDKKIGEVSARLNPVTTTNATLTMAEAYAEDITGVSFMVASYGSDSMAGVELKLNVSSDGSSWTTVKTLTGAADITDTLTQVTVDSIPAGARYLQFFATAAAASGKRINIDNIAVSFGGGPGPGAQVVIDGALTGTVNVVLPLTVSLLEAVADYWVIDLKDPHGDAVVVYNFDEETGAFSFTPDMAGTYTFKATAMDGDDHPIASKQVNLVVSAAPAETPIPPITYNVANGGLGFTLPDGLTISRVQGANQVVDQAWQWTDLTAGVDYTVDGANVVIATRGGVPVARMVRVYFQPAP